MGSRTFLLTRTVFFARPSELERSCHADHRFNSLSAVRICKSVTQPANKVLELEVGLKGDGCDEHDKDITDCVGRFSDGETKC